MAPATSSIASTPCTYATANGLPAAIAAVVRDWTSAPNAAIPAAMPSWRALLLTPEAILLWRGGTTASAATVTVGLTSPEPAPQTTSPGDQVGPRAVRVDAVHRDQPTGTQRQGAGQRASDAEARGAPRGQQRRQTTPGRTAGARRPP